MNWDWSVGALGEIGDALCRLLGFLPGDLPPYFPLSTLSCGTNWKLDTRAILTFCERFGFWMLASHEAIASTLIIHVEKVYTPSKPL